MSSVSEGGESSITTLTVRKLKKYEQLFGARLLTAPEEPVSASNAPEVRKWLELAKGDVVRALALSSIRADGLQGKIRAYCKELADAGTTPTVPTVIQDGLDQYDQLRAELRELGATENMVRSSSGASLRPEDSASHVSFGSVVRSSVQGSAARPTASVSSPSVPEAPVVNFKAPPPRPLTRSKAVPAVGSELMPLQQVRWSWTTLTFRG